MAEHIEGIEKIRKRNIVIFTIIIIGISIAVVIGLIGVFNSERKKRRKN